MNHLPLRQVESLLESPELRHLLKLDELIPLDQRTGRWRNLGSINAVLWQLKQHCDQVREWASKRAAVQTQYQDREATQAEAQAARAVEKVVGLFAQVGIRLGGTPGVDELRGQYRNLADEVDRHLRDKRNLGPDKSERHRNELNRRGGVIVENAPDPLVDTARAIRDALPEVEQSVAYARALRSNVNVDPVELDEKYVGQMRELYRQHGPTALIPGEDHRPSLPRWVGELLEEWGVLIEKSAT